MIYLMDANAFMEAAHHYYSFDLVPAFWDWLQGDSVKYKVGSVNAVRDEIVRGSGDLVNWTKGLPKEFWIEDSSRSVANMHSLVEWASDSKQPYTQPAVATFLASADLRLISVAMTIDGIVVTREVSSPRAKKSVKIPDVCLAFDVRCLSPFEAYRELGMRLT